MFGPTCNHDEIRRWAGKHRATPAEIRPYTFDSSPSILHFLFGEARSGTVELRPITWDDFFARFDLLNLALVYDDQPYFEILQVEPGSPLHRGQIG